MLAHVQDDVVRPRRIWEQQQMKIAVPTAACSPKCGRPAAPRAAPICPGQTLVVVRAASEHSQGEAAAFGAVATCPSKIVLADCVSCACPGAAAAVARAAPSPGHLPAAHCGAVTNGPVVVQPQESVIKEKGGAVNLLPQDMCVMEAVPTIAKVQGTSEKGHAAQISQSRKR